VAKKRKASKPSASAGKKKKKTASKPPRRIAVKPRTGLEDPQEVDFRPLKGHIKAHIERLSKVKEPSPAVTNAIRALRQVSDDLNVECQPSMIIPTP
jgi:hypothetical protein